MPPTPPRIDNPVRTAADRRAVERGCVFDVKAAERVWAFFTRFLRHSVGQFAGQPFVPLEWQYRDLLAPAYGWKRPDGTRRFRSVWCEVAKKNGKSTLCAGNALYLTVADGEPGAEVYSAAADRDQASIVYREAVRMVEASPALSSRLITLPSRREIAFPRGNSFYRVLSSEAHTKEGYNAHGLVADEVHAQPSPDLLNTLKYAGAARRQPLFWYITTAGFDRESVCWQMHCYAEAVLRDEVDDPEMLVVVYAAGEDDDWTAVPTWHRANPSLGHTISLDEMRSSCTKAQLNPADENVFKRYRLNLWTEQEERWLPVSLWDECVEEYAAADLEGETCYAGLDLASTRDINAFVLFFPESMRVLPFFWVPQAALQQRVRDKKTRLDRWVAGMLIKATPGNATDYDVIEDDVLRLAGRFRIHKIGVDRWNSLQLTQHLIDQGLDVVGFGQGVQSMTGPTKLFERLVVNKQIRHDGNPVMRWMFGNLVVKQDDHENIKPVKTRGGEKIDGMVSLVMALGVWLADEGPSVYEGQGIDTT